MRDRVADEDLGLPELRPVAEDRAVELEQAAVDEDEQAGGDQPLGAGKDHLKRVLRPGAARAPIGGPAPEVHDRLAVVDDRERGSELVALGEIAVELVAYALEARPHETADLSRPRHAIIFAGSSVPDHGTSPPATHTGSSLK